MRMKGLFVAIALVAVPTLASAQHEHPSAGPAVDFGVAPTPGPTGALLPIGPPPCLQAGAIGGPADPCAYKLHVLTPEETSVAKGGEVTFQIHGGGHGFAIYEVSKDTTRQELGQYLCAGADPARFVWLGALIPGDVEIRDPYGLEDAEAEHIVDRLCAASERLAASIAQSQGLKGPQSPGASRLEAL